MAHMYKKRLKYSILLSFAISSLFSSCYTLNTSVVNADYTSLVQSLNLLNKTVDKLLQDNEALKQDNAALQLQFTSLKAKLTSLSSDSVAFTAALTSATELGQDQIIRFDHIITNVGKGYDPRIGHFTAPVKGMYMFSFSTMSMSSKYLHLQLVKNGIELAHTEGQSQGYDTATVVIMTTLDVGDVVWVKHMSGSPSETIYGRLYSYFSGSLINKLN